MAGGTSTNATVAKARAMYGQRLTNDDYKQLINKGSVAEVAEYLKRNSHYRGALSAIDTNTVHRGFLESLLRRDNFDRYERLVKFQRLDKQPFYDYVIISMETMEIVNYVRYLNAGTQNNYIATLPVFLTKRSSFDLFEMARTRTFEALLLVIKKTPYYDLLKNEKADQNGLYDCTRLEVTLRRYYLKWLMGVISTEFSGICRRELTEMVGMQFDLINIINAFRMKAFNSANADTIMEESLPINQRLSRRQQRYLFEASDVDAFIDRLKKIHYGTQILRFDSEMKIPMIEHDVLRLRFILAKLRMRSASSAPVSLFAFFFLSQIEIDNITSIIEGIRYHAPIDYIENLLIYI